MSDLLQFGPHPDADQLNAFVEHTLPAHEREKTLAHLAQCSECREIVALSLPPLEEAPLAEPEPVATTRFFGWFSGWRLVWIAAPAFAALVILTIHFLNTASGRKQPTEVAEAHLPLPQATAPPAGGTLAMKASPASRSSASEGFAKVRKPSPSRTEPTADPSSVNDRDFRIEKSPPPVPVQSAAGSSPASGAMAGMSAATAPMTPGPPAQMPVPVQGAKQLAPNVPSAPAQGGPLAKPLPSASAALSNPVIDNAAGMHVPPVGQEHTFAARSALVRNGFVSTSVPLPSGQPILSFAANLFKLVAIDTHNSLFFSEDGGHHWKQVSATWPGHAVSVASIAGAAHANSPSFAVPERFSGGAFTSARISAQPDAAGSSLSGTVSDASGAVIAGAIVVVKESRYALVRTEKTDAAGHYLFSNLVPGSYRIDAEAPGFAKQSLVENLSASQQAVRNLVLSVGQTSQTVTVDAASVQLETQSRSSATPTPVSADKAKSVASRPSAKEHPPIFVITTDNGDRWTSADGENWKHE